MLQKQIIPAIQEIAGWNLDDLFSAGWSSFSLC